MIGRDILAVAAAFLLCLSQLTKTVTAATLIANHGESGVEGRHILVTTIFARGHTGPAMVVTLELASRGYHVTFAVQYQKGVADHYLDREIFEHPNITVLPLPLPDYVAEVLKNDLRILSELNIFEIITFTLESSVEAIQPLREEIRNHKPDLFICDVAFFGGLLVAKENPEVPFVRLSATMLMDTASKIILPFLGLDFPVPMNTWQRCISWASTAVFNSELLFKFGPFAEFEKKINDLGLPPIRSFRSINHGPVIVQSMMGLEPPHTIDPGYTLVGPIRMMVRS
eukprot:TRINITY_DN3668_c0_g2_i2.p1 TRINITY_DN3668_c0_g2~~TRINITY_DN3668_c0_g2_i2.p1  ORF type:complete len:285 (+),score=38.29 TRINITY_DN3668_c0_g2_i2:195-1049(+)